MATRSVPASSAVSKGRAVVPARSSEDNSVALAANAEGKSLVHGDEDEDVALVRRLLRQAIEESGVKHDAIAAALGLTDGSYLSKMLIGEKPIGAKHLRALPDEVERIFARLYAESFGHVVVTPAAGPDAVKQFVGGLLGILATPALPPRADRMAKSFLRADDEIERVG